MFESLPGLLDVARLAPGGTGGEERRGGHTHPGVAGNEDVVRLRGRGIPLLLPEGGAETLERIADPRAVLAAGDLDDELRRLGGLVGGEREIRPTDRHFVG